MCGKVNTPTSVQSINKEKSASLIKFESLWKPESLENSELQLARGLMDHDLIYRQHNLYEWSKNDPDFNTLSFNAKWLNLAIDSFHVPHLLIY